MVGVLGLAIGLVIGFLFANSVNRSGGEGVVEPNSRPTAQISESGLPPDHPPLGTSAGGDTRGGALPQVTEAIEKARREPNNYEAQMTAADLYYQIQRFDEAAKIYEAASKLRPSEPEPFIKTGNSLFDSGQYEQAEKWYLLALEKDPKNIAVRTDLGLTFHQRRPPDMERAIKEYRTALSLDPDHEITLQNLTLAYRESGDAENMRATMERLRAINPDNPVVVARPAQ